MELFLFSFDLKLAFTLAFIYIFIFPIIIFFTKRRKIWVYTYLATYIFLLILGVFTNVDFNSSNVSFTLLITSDWANNTINIAYFNFISILINLFLLFPLGVILSFLFKSNKKFYKIILFGIFTSISIEFLQFLLPIIRYPELLDVLTNTISVILGYLYYLVIEKALNRSDIYDKLPKQESDNTH